MRTMMEDDMCKYELMADHVDIMYIVVALEEGRKNDISDTHFDLLRNPD